MNTGKSNYPIIEDVNHDFTYLHSEEKRGIYAILPADYYRETSKRYPVFYMHDAQNLFDPAPFGSWQIDKALEVFKNNGVGDIIVIAIDHASEHRISEFMPYQSKLAEVHRGRTYSEFVSIELKQYIDKNYRTLPGREYTGMGGSSMGGLITIYAGIMFSHAYSKLMVFSPSLWAAPKIYFDAPKYLAPSKQKMYLYAGGRESKYMINNINRFKDCMVSDPQRSKGLNLKVVIDPDGQHNEWRWAMEFPKALQWLFFENKGHEDRNK